MIRIMTSNIWGDYFQNPVELRCNNIIETVRKYSPDVLGVQEITPSWHHSELFTTLSDEYTVLESRLENYVPLLYKTQKYKLLGCGWELYKETPDKSKGITWAVLQDKESGKEIGVCNTHLWWKQGPEHDPIRVKNAKQLLALMDYIKAKYDVLVYGFGDFNCVYDSAAMDFLRENDIVTSFEVAEEYSKVCTIHGDPVLGEDGAYHGKRTDKDLYASIDHVITYRNESVIKRQVVVEDQIILDATDHSPVYVDVEF